MGRNLLGAASDLSQEDKGLVKNGRNAQGMWSGLIIQETLKYWQSQNTEAMKAGKNQNQGS